MTATATATAVASNVTAPTQLVEASDATYEKPRLGRYLADPKLQGYAVLTKLLFELTESSQAAGEAFVSRLTQRKEDLDPPSGPNGPQPRWRRFVSGSDSRELASPICSASLSRRSS